MNTLEVLIVEDNIKISRTHQAFVDKVGGFTVTGIATTIAEARLLTETLEPDLILLDIYFSESNGIEFLKELRADRKQTDVILITAAREVEMLHSALQGGASNQYSLNGSRSRSPTFATIAASSPPPTA